MRAKWQKAQSASNAGAFLAILMVIIVLYILFLPPDVRDSLLNPENRTAAGITANQTSQLFRQKIGHVDYINTNEKSYDIPTVRVYATTSGQALKFISSAAVRSALFDRDQAAYSMDFPIDKSITKNMMLSFTVQEYSGPLIISLNGKVIANAVINVINPQPIKLDSADLQDVNTITFSVPNPGFAFWRTYSYRLENIQITGDVTDLKNSIATQHFTITEAEKNNLDTVKLFFNPVCRVAEVGPLEITINRKTIFDAVADCGTKNYVTLSEDDILAGTNEIRFTTDRGSYILDNLKVKLTLTKPAYNTYFFDLSEQYFEEEIERAECGKYDGICPVGCAEESDADCCFNQNGYWCALPTSNPNDRCVFYVDPRDCGLCKTGYYDVGNAIPETCENKCGDNDDGICPTGCSRSYDADCCYQDNVNNFWCQETPVTGLADKCRLSVSRSYCNLCPSGYQDDGGSLPDSCSGVDNSDDTLDDGLDEFTLLEQYDAKLTVRFTNDDKRKRVDLNINGHRITIDTSAIEYTRIIDDYVEEGTNSIEIIPREDIDIADISVDIKKVRS